MNLNNVDNITTLYTVNFINKTKTVIPNFTSVWCMPFVSLCKIKYDKNK
jgi:hypothetical protein